MRPVPVKARSTNTALLTDEDQRYCVFSCGDNVYAVYEMNSSGVPSSGLGYAHTLRDASMLIRRHRGPLSRKLRRRLIRSCAAAALLTWAILATPIALWHLLVAAAVLTGLIIVAVFVFLTVAFHEIGRTLHGQGLF